MFLIIFSIREHLVAAGAHEVRMCKNIESHPLSINLVSRIDEVPPESPLSIVNSIEESIWPRPPKYRIYRSGSPERVFSIINNSFDDDQDRAHADYIELSLQLQFNERSRSKA